MRTGAVVILLLLVSASLAFGMQNATDWIKYTSTEGRYTVSLPGQPQLSTQEATAGTGEKFPQYLASVTEPGDIAYMTGYFDSIPGRVFSADAARDGMVQRINGTLLTEKTISLGSYPGRDLKVLAKAAGGTTDYLVFARFFEVEKRIYVLQFIFPKSVETDALTARGRRYFDSFQVIK
ncbi:MAG TPA: hypothetical protein DHU55_06280 [Blastocatellia bacterium]|jgi:hypothetical protein|nr:hypothetical protein [Blastocatellia bacterium]HAF21581.1 hypothetical protein [Blastocatellia bacterium]HCX29369.1 hypothetical protein [Blastocatellia bacterium]